MNPESNQPEKKIIVDEDWKSQVEAEKEAARHAEESPNVSEEPPDDFHGPLPPADFTFLIGSLYVQGAMALGMFPNPMTNKPEVQPDHAKHAIDLLAMLQQKTEGNRTAQESEELETALHELRMIYVSALEGKAK
jgi:hypothetical protein